VTPLLVCCVGNAFLSPAFAALLDVEALHAGSSARAISAGLTNRIDAPPTSAHLLAAAGRVLGTSAALAVLRAHRPTPLRTRPREPVSGVLYLHESARSRRHLLDDAKVLRAWVGAVANVPVVGLAMDDGGYRLWEELGRPPLDSAEGERVVDAYAAQLHALRPLARNLVATLLAATDTAVALSVIPGTSELPKPIVAVPPAPVVEVTRTVRSIEPPPRTFVERTVRQAPATAVLPLDAPLLAPPPSTTPPEGRRRRVIQLPPPPPPPPAAAPPTRARTRRAASTAPPAAPALEPGGAPGDREPMAAPSERVDVAARGTKAAEASPAQLLVLEDVRSWLRAALPTSRSALVRWGLWKRAGEQFGSWEGAVEASGLSVAEPLWKLPRDPEVALDILVEALPDAVVARLAELSSEEVALHRRRMGGPSPAQQLTRRLVATERLGSVPDEQLAHELAVPVAEVEQVREREGIAPHRGRS